MTEVIQTNPVVHWPRAQLYLSALASRYYRQAAKASTEFERGVSSGRAIMCEELGNLPEALKLIQEADEDERRKSEGSGQEVH